MNPIEKPKHGNFADIEGLKVGRLTVMFYVGKYGGAYKSHAWMCHCDCGNKKIITGKSIMRRNGTVIRSCGCVAREKAKTNPVIHGMSYSRTYNIWGNMIQRCTNKNIPDFNWYGARGITVCETWKKSFNAFFAS